MVCTTGYRLVAKTPLACGARQKREDEVNNTFPTTTKPFLPSW